MRGFLFRLFLAALCTWVTASMAMLPQFRGGGLPAIPWSMLGIVDNNYVTDNTAALSNFCNIAPCDGHHILYCNKSGGILFTGQWLMSSEEWNEGNQCPMLATINSVTNTAVLSQANLTVPLVGVTLNNCNIDRGLNTATGTITGGTMLTLSGTMVGHFLTGMLVSDANNPRNVLRNTTIVSGTNRQYSS